VTTIPSRNCATRDLPEHLSRKRPDRGPMAVS
jgi:hypothetical protein